MLKYCNPTKIGKISVILIQKMSNSGIFVQEKGEVECPQGKKCAPLHVTNMRSIRISASGGDDDRRRAFPPPRQAVAAVRNPVFRHAGSWRHAGRAKSLDLNRTPEVVRGCASAVVRCVSSCVPHGRVVQ